jgi:hypothetical protein
MTVWAYVVVPGKGAESPSDPVGGRMDSSSYLDDALAGSTRRVRDVDWAEVVFRVQEISEPGTAPRRSCESRDLIKSLAFADAASADSSALDLARRLSRSMDQRTPLPHLLVAKATLRGRKGETRLWAFPQDDVFRFSVTDRPTLELLDQVFSRMSKLRKAARFDGENNDSDFIMGQVLDQQAGRQPTEVARYWVDNFLDCDFRMTPAQGTTMLAKAIQTALTRQTEPERRRELGVVAAFIPQAPARLRSLEDIVDELVPDHLRQEVLMSSPYPRLNAQPFTLESATFRALVGSLIFQLESGVIVTSPVSLVDRGDGLDRPVRVEGNHLSCEGEIVTERYRRGGGA